MQPCPRQAESAVMQVQLQHQSHWREDGTCSYCGSISPEQVFASIEEGFHLTPTDKNYKVYVERRNPHAGKPSIRSSSNGKEQPNWGTGWIKVTEENIKSLPTLVLTPRVGDWVKVGVESEMEEVKFYFQHFSEDDKRKFIELLNAKRIRLRTPGFFYRLPFFCRIEDKK